MANLRKIKELTNQKGLTLEYVAEEAGITPQALSNMLRSNNTKVSTLESISRVLGVSPAVFFAPAETSHTTQIVGVLNGQMAGRDITHNGASEETQRKWMGEISEMRELVQSAHRLSTDLLEVLKKMECACTMPRSVR